MRLWTLDHSAAIPRVLRGHSGPVTSVAFNLNSTRLASGSQDGPVRLWKLDQPETEPLVLSVYSGSVLSVAFSPDSAQLASGSNDHTVRLWNLQTNVLIREACRRASRNMTYSEWFRFLGEETYSKVCEELPFDRSFVIQKGRSLAKEGDVTAALDFVRKNLIVDTKSDWDIDKEARKRIAPALLDRGRELGSDGKIEAAVQRYTQSKECDPTLQIKAEYWNDLCWLGSLQRHAAEVMHACENAVRLEPENGGYRDSRGVARALTGDLAGAIADFKFYISWAQNTGHQKKLVPKRTTWIEALEAGQNPFDAETLESLKTE